MISTVCTIYYPSDKNAAFGWATRRIRKIKEKYLKLTKFSGFGIMTEMDTCWEVQY